MKGRKKNYYGVRLGNVDRMCSVSCSILQSGNANLCGSTEKNPQTRKLPGKFPGAESYQPLRRMV
ncbi:hypothetical protein [Desulfomonile tiedjei]|uniref:Uncharacterized protein n=1 Tax=Desulfomonile tiedjei (strain ATCC 49306 / DSM 6799 / DCB-1) TaxID=706587 RepID=I4CCN6_DESTA|nr:hypothetical protein [Desulfomonile tiedjei]AFM27327.1 hypothetical protein Desti_4707 [Desulfomonile tiedjei DSM 6799]